MRRLVYVSLTAMIAAPAMLSICTAAPASGDDLAVFAVGFTSVVDGGARLVFTTSVPTRSETFVEGATKAAVASDVLTEIHAHELRGLPTDRAVTLTIRATDDRGRMVQSGPHRLTARARRPRYDRFDHRTLIGVSHGANPRLWEQLGIGAYRIEVTWARLQPEAGVTDREYLASVVREVDEMRRLQIEPLILLCYSVPWTKEWTDRQMTWRRPEFGPPDHLEDWKAYVRVVMEALRGKARLYEIWNEPDAGYLATGDFVERPGLPRPIGRAPFKDNDAYWLGDRYVPLVRAAREVADEVDAEISLLNGGWNRDYHGWRGRLCFDRGLHRYIRQYAIHNYAGPPSTFEHWHHMTHDRFIAHVDGLFESFDVDMPLVVSEWGLELGSNPARPGFPDERDRRQFLLKSVFYYLSLERVNMLILHALEAGDRFSLMDPDSGEPSPSLHTFGWLCRTFSGRAYRSLPIKVEADRVQAYAVELAEDGGTYIALWSRRQRDTSIAPTEGRAPPAAITLPVARDGHHRIETLDESGTQVAVIEVAAKEGYLRWQQVLPPDEAGREPSATILYLPAGPEPL